MTERIALANADLDASDTAAVLEVLASGRLALGPKTLAFEQAFRDYLPVEHAVAVSSGTAALHCILVALELGPGDEVLVPSFTFAASVNTILMVGATPVFVDIDADTLGIDVADAEAKLTERTRAVMVVDVFGHPADWDGLERLAKAHGLLLIDDCCEALGSSHRDRRLGTLGDAGAFAFYPNKQITTGEGGMIVTDRDDVAEVARSLRNQGRGAMGAWLEHERLGFNYRLDEMSAALGASQMARLDRFVALRNEVAAAYGVRLAAVAGVTPPQVAAGVEISWFVYVVRVDADLDRDAIMSGLAQRGIPSRAYFTPLHTQPYLAARYGDLSGTLPVTEAISRRTISLPFHNRLTEAEIDEVASALAAEIERQRKRS